MSGSRLRASRYGEAGFVSRPCDKRVAPHLPVSSRGQDTWFSATGPGFESPYRYQFSYSSRKTLQKRCLHAKAHPRIAEAPEAAMFGVKTPWRPQWCRQSATGLSHVAGPPSRQCARRGTPVSSSRRELRQSSRPQQPQTSSGRPGPRHRASSRRGASSRLQR